MTKLVDTSLKDLLTGLGHPSPSMGGSTACILSALIGLAMVKMAVVISAEKKPISATLAKAETRIGSMALDLKAAAERDRQSFANYLDAAHRSHPDAMSAAQLNSTKVDAVREPLAAAHLIVGTLEFLQDVCPLIVPAVRSDAYSGAALLNSAFSGVMMAVHINLEPEQMSELRARTSGDRSRLIERRQQVFASLVGQATMHGFAF